MKASDVELDEAKRTDQILRIGQLAAKDIVMIPLFAKPQVLVVDGKRVEGDFDFNAGQAAFAHKLKGWSVKGSVKGSKELIVGADQWPICLNPVTATCASAAWLFYTAILPTQAQLLTLDTSNDYVPSPVVLQIPSLENGLLTRNPFTVTYNLNPQAKWEDGTTITGEDVKFTWQAFMKTKGAITNLGYDQITDVVTDGDRVTIKFKKPYAPWKDLFGGGNGVVLKKAAFGGDPNLEGKMATDLAGISGNAFKLESFDRDQMVLVKNATYFGPQAKVDRVVFKRFETPTDQLEAFRNGTIQAFFPQQTAGLLERTMPIPGAKVQVKAGTVYEGLWFNLDAFPVNDKAVRQALLFGLDRQKVLEAVVKPIQPDAVINTCSFGVKNLAGGKYCGDQVSTEFNTDKAIKALIDGGWQKRTSSADDKTILGWSKDGKELVIRLATTSGSQDREQIQLILAKQLAAIGIELRWDNSLSGVLFRTRLPARDFTVGLFGLVATADPSVTVNWSKDQIPGPSAVSASG